MNLNSIIGGRPTMTATVPANAGPVAVSTDRLLASSYAGAQAVAGPISPQGGSAAVAAGVLGFAAVGLLVVMRVVFRGAVS